LFVEEEVMDDGREMEMQGTPAPRSKRRFTTLDKVVEL
jgi:hypothetical protein